ncbi:MAG: hypothetical protein H7177_06505 [Rhizobacter sp.]|nr:hypothetical protein [Bacteriovorax sp.]
MNESKNLKILVADDDLTFLEIADEKLSQRGFDVLVATLSEAVNILKREVVGTVFIDFNKSKTDGAKVLRLVDSLEVKPLVQYFGQLSEIEESHQLYC